jgi:RNA polymerase sigma factor (sigma-70 family)
VGCVDTGVSSGSRCPSGTPLTGRAPLAGQAYGADVSEEVLVADARTGQAAAYEELVRRHQGVAYRTAAMIVGTADAEDVAQEAIVKAYRALPRFRAEAPFRPWLLAIVANEARNRRRSVRRHGGAIDRLAALGATEMAGDPADQIVSSDRRSTLIAAIRTLPDPDQLVICSRYLMELSEAETAAAMQCPVGTVKSRLSRALVRLKDAMNATTEGGEPR